MSLLTVEDLVRSGVQPTFNAASASGDSFQNDGKTLVYIKNGATDVNVTFTAQKSSTSKPGFGDLSLTDQVVNVPATQERAIGFFESAIFNDVNGQVQITYDNEVNVTVAVLKAPRVT